MCMVTFDWEDNDAKEKVKEFLKKGLLSWAVVEVTDACNLNCIWCYASSGYGSRAKRNHMSKSGLERVVRTLAKAGVRQITYSGGEPTIYPHIRHAVRIAKESGMVVHMNTNGFVLTKRFAQELKKLGLSQIQTNIDSMSPEKHDRIRGRKGSFTAAVNALKAAREVGLTCASQTVLTKENEGEILDIFRFARSMGVQRCRLWDMMPPDQKGISDDLMPTDYIGTLRDLAGFAEETGAFHIESGEPLFPLDYKTSMKVSNVSCVAAMGVLINISCRGDVYFCVTDRKPMFNIFRDLKGKELQEFYSRKLKERLDSSEPSKKCNECSMFEKCRGGCHTRRQLASNSDYWCRM